MSTPDDHTIRATTAAPGWTHVPQPSAGPRPKAAPAAPAAGKPHPEALLPTPDFTSPAAVRHYCNSLRALMTGLSFELAMASEILQGTLAQVPDPDGRPFGDRVRARKVSRKLTKAADAAKAAAVNAAATYSAFQQEYQEEINRVRHRARVRVAKTPRIDWADQ